MKVHPELEPRLLLIRQQEELGELPDCGKVYKITKVVLLPLSKESPKNLEIDMCRTHHTGIKRSSEITRIPDGQQKPLQKTWNQLRNAAESVKPKKKESKEKERFERKITEEIHKMFQDSTFYYCSGGDVTNCTQRQRRRKETESTHSDPLWKHAHDAFFWNKYMLQDLITSENPLADVWIVPVIQGYVQIETCTLTFEDQYSSLHDVRVGSAAYQAITYKLCLVSRRSRYRAGTRYKRRGVDEEGNCANFVETEQILEFSNHVVSFVQTRGSVPLYWSQTGIKYKPPPRIDKGEEENHVAFSEHLQAQLGTYQQVSLVSLLDLGGKEKVVADTFLQHVVKYNSPDITYIAFDFHEYCRGMKFENVAVLTETIIEEIKHMRYCWADVNGVICEQRGVFRVNCLDCLDRTNVVQSAIARLVLEIQSRKLGLLPPDEALPRSSRLIYQQMWANNGDAISRQYAGTAALKGDFTRTGERRLAGMMKDGVNSANRYYINKVKDAYKQTAIDLLLGNSITEDLSALRGVKAESGDEPESNLVEKEQNLKVLIDECRKMLITEPEHCQGSWGLIDCDPNTGDPTQQDMDIILLLSQRAYYVARYDDEADVVTSYQKIYLEDIERIEIGTSPYMVGTKAKHMCVRIYYLKDDDPGYFHTFRTTGTRLFNNIVIHINNEEEAKESMRAIYESFAAARQMMSHPVDLKEGSLERKRTKKHPDIIDIASQAQEKADVLPKPAVLAQVDSSNNLAAFATIDQSEQNGVASGGKISPSTSHQEDDSNRASPTSDVNSSPTRQPSANRSFASVAKATRSSAQRSMTNFTKSLFKLKPAARGSSSKPANSGLPAVWFSRDDENAGGNGNEVTGSARILKGERISVVGDDQKSAQNEELLIDFSTDDMTNPAKESTNQSLHNPDLLIDLGSLDTTENNQSNQTLPRQTEGLLIDIEDEVPALPSTASVKQHESSAKKPPIQGQMSLDPSRLKQKPAQSAILRNKDKVLDSSGIVFVYPHQHRIIPYPKFCLSNIRQLLKENVMRSKKPSFILGQSDSGQSVTDAESPLIEIGVDATALDEWVNVDVFDDSAQVGALTDDNDRLKAPSSRSMRGSVSDSALSDGRHSNMESLIVSACDLDREDAQSAAQTFTRVRMRVSAIPVQPSDSPHARRKAVLDLATRNKRTAQKMFRQCKSKIILL